MANLSLHTEHLIVTTTRTTRTGVQLSHNNKSDNRDQQVIIAINITRKTVTTDTLGVYKIDRHLIQFSLYNIYAYMEYFFVEKSKINNIHIYITYFLLRSQAAGSLEVPVMTFLPSMA